MVPMRQLFHDVLLSIYYVLSNIVYQHQTIFLGHYQNHQDHNLFLYTFSLILLIVYAIYPSHYEMAPINLFYLFQLTFFFELPHVHSFSLHALFAKLLIFPQLHQVYSLRPHHLKMKIYHSHPVCVSLPQIRHHLFFLHLSYQTSFVRLLVTTHQRPSMKEIRSL